MIATAPSSDRSRTPETRSNPQSPATVSTRLSSGTPRSQASRSMGCACIHCERQPRPMPSRTELISRPSRSGSATPTSRRPPPTAACSATVSRPSSKTSIPRRRSDRSGLRSRKPHSSRRRSASSRPHHRHHRAVGRRGPAASFEVSTELDAGAFVGDRLAIGRYDIDFQLGAAVGPSDPRQETREAFVITIADWNADGTDDVTDLLAFLAQWFDGDVDLDSSDVIDLLTFLGYLVRRLLSQPPHRLAHRSARHRRRLFGGRMFRWADAAWSS